MSSSMRHLLCFFIIWVSLSGHILKHTSHDDPYAQLMAKFPRSGQHYSRLTGSIYISSATNYITLHLVLRYFQCHVSRIILVGRKILSHMNRLILKRDHLIRGIAGERGFDLIIVSSLCRIHSESLHGFCHFHLNCSSH